MRLMVDSIDDVCLQIRWKVNNNDSKKLDTEIEKLNGMM